MKVYWYITRSGIKKGYLNKAERNAAALQNYARELGECDISDFTGELY